MPIKQIRPTPYVPRAKPFENAEGSGMSAQELALYDTGDDADELLIEGPVTDEPLAVAAEDSKAS